jgi:hypothetical protein
VTHKPPTMQFMSANNPATGAIIASATNMRQEITMLCDFESDLSASYRKAVELTPCYVEIW